MDANHDVLRVLHVTADQGNVMLAVQSAQVKMQFEVTMLAGEIDDFNFLDQLLSASAIFDELFNGADFELMFLGKALEFWQPGHVARVIHDFTDDADRTAFGEFG